MSATAHELRSRNLRTLGALAALFLLPLLAAFWLYYATDWRPQGRVNHGELIAPARPLPQVLLPRVEVAGTRQPSQPPRTQRVPTRGKWSLIYVGAGRCEEACRRALYAMRQARLALANDMTRVERVLLVTEDCCDREFLAREHPGLVVLEASGAQGARLLQYFPVTAREQSLFVVDPLGNLMMRYDARLDPKGLLQDLQKLLRLSQIG